ncbi:hypothetical protein TNCV_808881 [Trichonephila clavipes]|nr:hypothetical protein TNCV_808881 [Trichonephila clavipes]
MFDPSSFVNPTPLAHADTSRDVLPRGGTSQVCLSDSATPLQNSNISTYKNSELRDFQISSIRLFFSSLKLAESVPEPYETGNVIEKLVDLVRQINLEAESG